MPNPARLLHLLLAGCLLAACTPATVQPAPPDANATALAVRYQAAKATEAGLQYVQTAAAAPTVAPAAAAPTAAPQPDPAATSGPTPDLAPTLAPSATPDRSEQYAELRILFYEEWPTYSTPQYKDYESYIATALAESGLQYKYYRETPGTLLNRLKDQAWDLVIISSEARPMLPPELYPALWRHLEAGGAAIVESPFFPFKTEARGDQYTYDLFWANCGVTMQDGPYDTWNNTVLLTDPENPLFTWPNWIETLGDSTKFWKGDYSDLFVRLPGGRAQGLAQISDRPNRDMALVSCLDGRLLLQTFPTHNYPRATMIALWQNYIANALEARFRSMEARSQEAPPDPLRDMRAEAQVLVYEGDRRDAQLLKNLGFRHITYPKTAGSVKAKLERQDWNVIIYTFIPNEQEQMALLPLIQAQHEQGAAVLIDFSVYADDARWKSVDPPEAVQAVLAGCGVSFTAPQSLGSARPQWSDPGHPLGIFPGANLEPYPYFPYHQSLRLFQRAPESQAWFPVSLLGGAGPDQRGALVICPGERLALQAVPIGSREVFIQNLLDFFQRPRQP